MRKVFRRRSLEVEHFNVNRKSYRRQVSLVRFLSDVATVLLDTLSRVASDIFRVSWSR